MSKNSSGRLPHFGKVLFLALVISLGVSVWSVQNAPTNTKQEAATTTCTSNGGVCYKYSCPSGMLSTGGSCGNIADSACCTSKTLATPTGVKSYAWYCKFGDPLVEYDSINFNWDPVKYASRYTIYHRIYNSGSSYKTINISGYDKTAYLYEEYKNLNGRRVQWYLKASNDYGSSISSVYTTPYAFLSCPQ